MKILSISDIHGLDVWKEAVKIPADHYIFLGDFVDSFTKTDDEIITNLLEIIGFKKKHPNKVTLLIGNHDLEYWSWISPRIGVSGYRQSYAKRLEKIFKENILFKVAAEFGENEKRIIYTHAGICEPWLERNLPFYSQNYEKGFPDIVEQLNDMRFNGEILKLLQVGRIRGGQYDEGSPLWAHITEFDKWQQYDDGKNDWTTANIPLGFHQVVGHNRIGKVVDKPPVKWRDEWSITFTDNLEDGGTPYFHMYDTGDLF